MREDSSSSSPHHSFPSRRCRPVERQLNDSHGTHGCALCLPHCRSHSLPIGSNQKRISTFEHFNWLRARLDSVPLHRTEPTGDIVFARRDSLKMATFASSLATLLEHLITFPFLPRVMSCLLFCSTIVCSWLQSSDCLAIIVPS